MDTMKDTKMQPATDAVIEELRKMQPTAWVYEDMLGRKCVGFERPLPRSNTHEPLFSAANHAVIMGLINLLDAAEKKRDALRAKIEAMEKQEPVAYLPPSSARILESGVIANAVVWNCRDKAAADMPLYALPGAQPASSVPVDILYRLGAAHDACLDGDHRACRDAITQLMCEIGPDGAVPEPKP